MTVDMRKILAEGNHGIFTFTFKGFVDTWIPVSTMAIGLLVSIQ